jgi:hypothetical protein
VAKQALIQRELKRDKLVAKYAKVHADNKAIANDAKATEEQRDHRSSTWYVPSVRLGSRQDP